MAGVLHGSARTTPRVRSELQASQEATRALAAQYRLNPKTVSKWRKRTTIADQPMGPARPRRQESATRIGPRAEKTPGGARPRALKGGGGAPASPPAAAAANRARMVRLCGSGRLASRHRAWISATR